MSGDNFTQVLVEMLRRGEIPRGVVVEAEVLHDDDCSIFTGGQCDCAPEIRLRPQQPRHEGRS